MGIGALVLQQVADFAVSIGLRGMSPVEQLANFKTLAGAVYAALLLAFAAMPVRAGQPATEMGSIGTLRKVQR